MKELKHFVAKGNNAHILFSILGVAVVLWQLLGSGYVLTLDAVFGPHVDLVRHAGDLVNSAPWWTTLSWLTTLFGGMVAEKIVLVTLFFTLFYFPLRYFQKIVSLETTHGVEYIVAAFFVVNPFVYERFLAGHWMALFGYAMLFPVTYYTSLFFGKTGTKNIWSGVTDIKNFVKLLASLLLLGILSMHFLVMAIVMMMVFFVIQVVSVRGSASFLARGLVLLAGFILGSSYWLVPAFLSSGTVVASFGKEQWEAFKTIGNNSWEVLGNVLSLHGFWEEGRHFASRFLFPKDDGILFYIALTLLGILICAGIFFGIRSKESRNKVFFMLLALCLAIIFSAGVGESIFKNTNMWMFENVSFWKGFRDSQKWSGVIAFIYALLLGIGASALLARCKKHLLQKETFIVLIAIPLMYTPMMLFGFGGQLRPVDYPNDWSNVNTLLKKNTPCKAVFLPWHQYYSLVFNDNHLTANLARSYFDCDVFVSNDMELLGPLLKNKVSAENTEVDTIVTNNLLNPDDAIQKMKAKGIEYIIYTNDISYEDPYLYNFLKSPLVQRVYQAGGIELFQIKP